MTRRLKFDDVIAMTADPDAKPILVRITPQAFAALMATRWIPEDRPDIRVKVVGFTQEQDGFSLPLLVSENAA